MDDIYFMLMIDGKEGVVQNIILWTKYCIYDYWEELTYADVNQTRWNPVTKVFPLKLFR